MIKRFVILRRNPGMSVEEFRHYWKNTHGPLIAKIPGLIQYYVRYPKLEFDFYVIFFQLAKQLCLLNDQINPLLRIDNLPLAQLLLLAMSFTISTKD